MIIGVPETSVDTLWDFPTIVIIADQYVQRESEIMQNMWVTHGTLCVQNHYEQSWKTFSLLSSGGNKFNTNIKITKGLFWRGSMQFKLQIEHVNPMVNFLEA